MVKKCNKATSEIQTPNSELPVHQDKAAFKKKTYKRTDLTVLIPTQTVESDLNTLVAKTNCLRLKTA